VIVCCSLFAVFALVQHSFIRVLFLVRSRIVKTTTKTASTREENVYETYCSCRGEGLLR